MTVVEIERSVTTQPLGVHPAVVSLRSASVETKLQYAAALSDANLLPPRYYGKKSNVLWATEYGLMIGLPPMAVITGVYFVDGKPCASAGLISALVRHAGHRLRVYSSTDERGFPVGHAEITRRDDPDFKFTTTFTVDDAQLAGLCEVVLDANGRPRVRARDGKGNAMPWEKYTKALVKHRAMTATARDACEESMYGLHYTPEELGAEVNEEGIPIITDAQPSPQAAASNPEDVVAANRRESFDQAKASPAGRRTGPIVQGEVEVPAPDPEPIQVIVTDPATDEQRMEYLLAEMKWMSKLVGSNVKNAIIRQKATNFDKISIVDLQEAVGTFRSIVIGQLKESGRHREAEAYDLWGTDHIAPIQVMLGNEAPVAPVTEPEQGAIEPAVEAATAAEPEQAADVAEAEGEGVEVPPQSVTDITGAVEVISPSVTEVPFDGESHPFDPREDHPGLCSECGGTFDAPYHAQYEEGDLSEEEMLSDEAAAERSGAGYF